MPPLPPGCFRRGRHPHLPGAHGDQAASDADAHLLTSLLQGWAGCRLPSAAWVEREQGEGFSFILNKMFHLFSICVDNPTSVGQGQQKAPAKQLKTFLDVKFSEKKCLESNVEL